MLNFFTRPGEDDGTVYRFREPSLGRQPTARHADTGPRKPAGAPVPVPGVRPTNYGDIVAFFRRTVAERKSPYNQLCRAADKLRDYIPDEIGRLKVAWGVLQEQISAEALSLAIDTHLNDIDLARQKAARHTPEMVAGQVQRLEQDIANGRQTCQTLENEMTELRQRLQTVEARHRQASTQVQQLQKELDTLRSGVNSASFLDQAAENEKNDLLARKALLGLE